MAEIYQKQGLRVVAVDNEGIQNEIKQKIMEVTGLGLVMYSVKKRKRD